MKGIYLIAIALASFASCHTTRRSTIPNDSIVGKYWKLIEINGQSVQLAGQGRKEAHMIFNAPDKSVNGNGSCNSFFGSYTLEADDGISFSKIGATKMACSNDLMRTEQQLFQAFEMTTNFRLMKDTLSLIGSDMSTLAKFVVNKIE